MAHLSALQYKQKQNWRKNSVSDGAHEPERRTMLKNAHLYYYANDFTHSHNTLNKGLYRPTHSETERAEIKYLLNYVPQIFLDSKGDPTLKWLSQFSDFL